MDSFKLKNGVEIPKIGFGTYKSVAGADKEVISRAIAAGYRHFDTASFYNNEEILGQSLAESGIGREEFFLTTKVWKADMGYDSALRSAELSMEHLQTDYLDLLLIHWPRAELAKDNWRKLDKETWRAFEELYAQKKVRAVGVSNFLPHHLLNIMEGARVLPMVDQIEFHPGYTQPTVLNFCRENGILAEAWSPIGRGRVFEEPLLTELSGKYKKSAAQICLRFALQCGVLPLPKSSSTERMKENQDVFDFEITKEDMYRIATLPQIGWSGEHPDRERVYFS